MQTWNVDYAQCRSCRFEKWPYYYVICNNYHRRIVLPSYMSAMMAQGHGRQAGRRRAVQCLHVASSSPRPRSRRCFPTNSAAPGTFFFLLLSPTCISHNHSIISISLQSPKKHYSATAHYLLLILLVSSADHINIFPYHWDTHSRT